MDKLDQSFILFQVRLQTQADYRSILDCLVRTYRNETVRIGWIDQLCSSGIEKGEQEELFAPGGLGNAFWRYIHSSVHLWDRPGPITCAAPERAQYRQH